jgi:hypothetical protein
MIATSPGLIASDGVLAQLAPFTWTAEMIWEFAAPYGTCSPTTPVPPDQYKLDVENRIRLIL